MYRCMHNEQNNCMITLFSGVIILISWSYCINMLVVEIYLQSFLSWASHDWHVLLACVCKLIKCQKVIITCYA